MAKAQGALEGIPKAFPAASSPSRAHHREERSPASPLAAPWLHEIPIDTKSYEALSGLGIKRHRRSFGLQRTGADIRIREVCRQGRQKIFLFLQEVSREERPRRTISSWQDAGERGAELQAVVLGPLREQVCLDSWWD